MTDRTEKIMAYLDGQMSENEMVVFEAEMEKDPDLAEEVARLASNDQLLRDAFDEPMQQPVDVALLARMGLSEPPTTNVAEFPVGLAANDNPPTWRKWQWPVGGAIAASLALIFVMQDASDPAQPDAFSVAMSKTPSSATAQLASNHSVSPRLTFAAKDGRYCREFLEINGKQTSTGIACQSAGKWSVEARIKGGEALPNSEDIMTAGGEDSSALDAAYERLGASDPINAEAERDLIRRRWTR